MQVYELNQNEWGVCGFVSAIQAAYSNNVKKDLLKSDSYNTLFPVVKDFCTASKDLTADLLNFSATFGSKFTYPNLDAIVSKMQSDTSMSEDNIGIAMTAEAVSRLCKSFGFKNCNFIGTTSSSESLSNITKYKNTLFGLGHATGNNFRMGLVHWVYVDSQGSLMTWGEEVKSNNVLGYLESKGFNKITHYIPTLN